MASYETAALHISFLRDAINNLNLEIDSLDNKLEELRLAHHYMMALVELIRDNPAILEGWKYFLQIAGIEEPDWKHEYENDD